MRQEDKKAITNLHFPQIKPAVLQIRFLQDHRNLLIFNNIVLIEDHNKKLLLLPPIQKPKPQRILKGQILNTFHHRFDTLYIGNQEADELDFVYWRVDGYYLFVFGGGVEVF